MKGTEFRSTLLFFVAFIAVQLIQIRCDLDDHKKVLNLIRQDTMQIERHQP